MTNDYIKEFDKIREEFKPPLNAFKEAYIRCLIDEFGDPNTDGAIRQLISGRENAIIVDSFIFELQTCQAVKKAHAGTIFCENSTSKSLPDNVSDCTILQNTADSSFRIDIECKYQAQYANEIIVREAEEIARKYESKYQGMADIVISLKFDKNDLIELQDHMNGDSPKFPWSSSSGNIIIEVESDPHTSMVRRVLSHVNSIDGIMMASCSDIKKLKSKIADTRDKKNRQFTNVPNNNQINLLVFRDTDQSIYGQEQYVEVLYGYLETNIQPKLNTNGQILQKITQKPNLNGLFYREKNLCRTVSGICRILNQVENPTLQIFPNPKWHQLLRNSLTNVEWGHENYIVFE